MQSFVYGPVPSRRLGRSLGIDLVPFKTCTYDCIYCQLGRTTNKTCERKEWVSLENVLQELRGKLDTKPDYITLSGSGEPTLCLRIGNLIEGIKRMTDISVAVLTNGSLLWLPEVRDELMSADLVLPSLDAGNEELFNYVNRPHPDITFDRMVEGLIQFRASYPGRYWLEVVLLGGVTGIAAEVERIARIVKRIGPDRVQLNTATRPPVEDFAFASSPEKLREFADYFSPRAEVIADFTRSDGRMEFAGHREDVLGLLSRRPCTVEDVAHGLGMHRNEAIKFVDELLSAEALQSEIREGRQYYKTKQVTRDRLTF